MIDTLADTDGIRFYCGINEKSWNYHQVTPGSYACIAPVTGKTIKTKRVTQVSVNGDVKAVILDSAAFSDAINQRLTFNRALDRQIYHAKQFSYHTKVSHLASYDLLIDEKWSNGTRSKARWSIDDAQLAVKETVQAAQYLTTQRKYIASKLPNYEGLILSAQGVELEQYMQCVQQIIPMLDENDILGLGGWCVLGLKPNIRESFRSIILELIPYVSKQNIRRIHIWGVIHPQSLAMLLWLCDQYNIKLSTDSAGPCYYPAYGNWGYGSYHDTAYKLPCVLPTCTNKTPFNVYKPTCTPDTRCRGLERIRHVQHTIEYLNNIRTLEATLYINPIEYNIKS